MYITVWTQPNSRYVFLENPEYSLSKPVFKSSDLNIYFLQHVECKH